jgi:aromatic ring-cleaving dioxygenase
MPVTDHHVHVFFSLAERSKADDVARRLEAASGLSPSSWTTGAAGPFLSPMFQVNVPADAFAVTVPWLMLNRGELAVLVHPLTGDDLADHTTHAAWLGEQQPLALDVF